MRRLIVLLGVLLVILGLLSFVAQFSPRFQNVFQKTDSQLTIPDEKVKIVSEESVVIDVVKKSGPSVVTIAAEVDQQAMLEQDPFSIFGFRVPRQQQPEDNEPRNIGSGFIISQDGIIVTNKHVVSDRNTKYIIVTAKDQKFNVEKIYRDPLNDIAILKINPAVGSNLQPLALGDSSKLQAGQLVIAIGTPLGEFTSSVTTGVVSGLGRGITAGSYFEGFVEQLDNVIQTDAAINPGNSGGPLLDSSGRVIGVNTAVSQSGQNIGFALPINTIKDSIKNFNETGQFNRPYLGVAYQMITREQALRNDLAEGAYVQSVVEGSAAAKAGVEAGDIITKIDGNRLQANTAELSKFVSGKKIGDSIKLTIFRDEETFDVTAVLEAAPEQ